MKAALCFAVCLLLMVSSEAEDSSSILPMFKKKFLNGPRATSQECTELYGYIEGNSNEVPSAIQSCYDAIANAENQAEATDMECSCPCQSQYDLFVQCYGQGFTDGLYGSICPLGEFISDDSTCTTGTANSAGSTTVYISLLVIADFLAVFATVF